MRFTNRRFVNRILLSVFIVIVGINSLGLAQTRNVKAQQGDYYLTVSPSQVTVDADGIAQYSIRITSVNNFAGTVKLDATGLPTGASYSFQPSILQLVPNADAYSILVVIISPQLYPGGYSFYNYYYPWIAYQSTMKFNVVATGGGINKTAPASASVLYGYTGIRLTLNLQPGNIVVSGNISQVKNQTIQIGVTSSTIPNFNYYLSPPLIVTPVFSVTPTLIDPPLGLSISFNPVSATLSSSSNTLYFNGTVLMTPDFLQRSGTYRLAVAMNAILMGSSLGLTYSGYYTNVLLTKVVVMTIVVPPYITLTTSPTILKVPIGGSDQKMQISINAVSIGLSEPITLSVTGVPTNVTASFDKNILIPNPQTGGQLTSNLVFSAPSTLSSGIFPIVITATTLGITQRTNASVYLLPQGDYALQSGDTTIGLNANGNSRSTTITIIPEGGFRSRVSLSVTQLPSGVLATLTPQNVTVQSDAPITLILTLVAQPNTPPGTFNIAVVSSTGFTTHSVNLTLLVRSGTTALWPIVLLIVVVIALLSGFAFMTMPKGKHVHVIREQ